MPVKAFEYPRALDLSSSASLTPIEVECEPEAPEPEPGPPPITEADLAAAYENGKKEGRREAELRLNEQLKQGVSAERAQVSKVIEEFQQGCSDYYSKVEDQVVHLALGIAAKILHRESQVDPMLLMALVKLATENLKQGSKVQVNVRPEETESWRRYFERDENGRVKIEMVEDSTLAPGDCIVHSEVGIAALGINAQLKEIERGLFDLLAQRPKND
jgi:flagellar assembly protein FliH